MPLSPDTIQAVVAVLGALGTFLVTLGAFWWRLSGKVHEILATQAAVVAELERVRGQIAAGARYSRTGQQVVEKRLFDLERSFAVLTASLGEREKDIIKLESRAEIVHDDLLKVVASLQQVMGSSDAIWRGLHKIDPIQFPRRASDRG